MKLRGQKKKEIEKQIEKTFPNFTLDDTAPQGQNCYSTNYILTDSRGIKYLLKSILKKQVSTVANKKQVETEINICKSVKSPFVVNLIEVKETDDYVFLLFPFLEGEDISNLLKEENTNLPNEREIIEIGIGILNGIKEIHRKHGINHQDIKPENIFLDKDGNIKLLDFGAARYKQSPYKGASKHNYAFSSPEQILASPPNNVESLRITFDDRWDVYSVGLVLYKLVTGSHPFDDYKGIISDAIRFGENIPMIKRKDISEGLKRVVMSMLEYDQLNRPNAQTAVNFLENGDIIKPVLKKGGFYYCATSGTKRYIEAKKQDKDLFDGIVLNSSNIPQNKKTWANLRIGTHNLIINPETYLFQKPDLVSESSDFKKLPYYKYKDSVEKIDDFYNKVVKGSGEVENFVEDVVNFQIQKGASVIIPPFFHIEEFNDPSWSLDQEITRFAIPKVVELANKKPILKGVSIPQEILTSKSSRKKILEYLTSLHDVDGFLLFLNSPHMEVITDESWLSSAKHLFTTLLSTGKLVIWNQADISGLLFSPQGLSISMGEHKSQRKFNITAEKQRGGPSGTFFYIPAMFARAKWPQALKSFREYADKDNFICNQYCCKGNDFDNLQKRDMLDLFLHMLKQFSVQYRGYSNPGGQSKILSDISIARNHYKQLQKHASLKVRKGLENEVKPSNPTFLERWENILNNT